MNRISVSYPLIYQFKQSPNYKVTKCLKVFNCKTGRQLKKCYKDGSLGYWLFTNKGKVFAKIGDKKLLELIPRTQTPF